MWTVRSHHGQVGTAGLDLVLYVGHLPDALHTAFLGVAEIAGGVDVLVQVMQPVDAQGRGVQRRGVGRGQAAGEDPEEVLIFPACALSHLFSTEK